MTPLRRRLAGLLVVPVLMAPAAALAADAAAWLKLPDLTGTWVVDSRAPPPPPYNA